MTPRTVPRRAAGRTADHPSPTPHRTADHPSPTPHRTADHPSPTPHRTADHPSSAPHRTADHPSSAPHRTADGPPRSPECADRPVHLHLRECGHAVAGCAVPRAPGGRGRAPCPRGCATDGTATGRAVDDRSTAPAAMGRSGNPPTTPAPADRRRAAMLPTGTGPATLSPAPLPDTPVAAVLFDRDGTLVEDVPYNGDPDLVRPMPGAREALDLLRAAGVPTGVVSNQSGIGRGLLTDADVRRVNERADALLGGLDTWVYCPHLPGDGCACRKPRPGLVLEAARRLGVDPGDCVLIGDIAADVLAARAAGARGVLVPTAATLPEEVAAAPLTARDLLTAVRTVLTGTRGGRS